MNTIIIVLAILLSVSLLANILLWYKWHSYRTKPAGSHSYTGMMPRVDREKWENDQS